VEVEAVSAVYETEPVGEILDQPDFLNAAVRIRTELGPQGLLRVCKAIEVELGRMFGAPRHGPRPIDIDLLLLTNELDRESSAAAGTFIELESQSLTLPHPEVTSRRFVLVPLVELDPALVLPDGTRLTEALDRLGPGQRVDPAGRL
jgi:2-amino-4-hydroxy-6-hydroxymethyldihydropteridine diphosphokinase